MSNHNPKRALFAGLTAIVVTSAAFLAPGVASADAPKPQPHAVFIGGGAQTGAIIGAGAGAAGGACIWVPQGSPVVEREQLGFVDAPGGQLLMAGTYGRGNAKGITATDTCGSWPTVVSAASPR